MFVKGSLLNKAITQKIALMLVLKRCYSTIMFGFASVFSIVQKLLMCEVTEFRVARFQNV